MIYPSADKLENWGSKFALVTLAAKRAKQLKSGAPPLIETESRNPLTVALEEIAAGVITCEVPDVDTLAMSAGEPEIAQLLAIPEEMAEEHAAEAEEAAGVEEPVVLDDEVALHDEEEEIEEEEEEEEEPHDEWAAVLSDETDAEGAVAGEEPAVVLDPDLAVLDDLTKDEDKPKRRGRRKAAASADVTPEVDLADVEIEDDLTLEDKKEEE
jgi:DNA-directed RNA polymerase subunit omega